MHGVKSTFVFRFLREKKERERERESPSWKDFCPSWKDFCLFTCGLLTTGREGQLSVAMFLSRVCPCDLFPFCLNAYSFPSPPSLSYLEREGGELYSLIAVVISRI
jgi:hypothetical protein